MIDWASTATRLGYADETALWTDLYVTQGLAIAEIAKRLDISRNTVRQALIKAHVERKKRGGANNVREPLAPELLEEVQKNGISATAKAHGLSYTTLYKRLRKAVPLITSEEKGEAND